MRSRTLSAVVLVVTTASCMARRGATSDSELNLPAPGAPATIFADGIVSTGDVFASTFTPDGRTVVFTKFAPPRMMLMASTFADGRWTPPAVLPFSGVYRDLDPAFSPNGSRLYFSSWRPRTASPADTANASDTWYVDRRGGGWSQPVRLPDPVNSAAVDMYPSVTRRGVLYFDSARSSRQRLVYRAELGAEGASSVPEALPPIVNADSGASNLFVDADERYIVFGAVRPGGAGSMDLYVSRHEGGGWSEPRNLGPLVNTANVEFCPFVSRDGRYLYFTRVSAPGVTPVTRNVYVVRFDALLAQLSR